MNFTGLRYAPTESRLSPLAGFVGALFGQRPSDAPQGDPAGVKDLLENRISFIGISAYAPFTGPGFAPNELENAAFMIRVGAAAARALSLVFSGARVLVVCVRAPECAACVRVLGEGGGAGVKDLLENRISFIGISAYAPFTGPGFALNELENAAFMIRVGVAPAAAGRHPRARGCVGMRARCGGCKAHAGVCGPTSSRVWWCAWGGGPSAHSTHTPSPLQLHRTTWPA